MGRGVTTVRTPTVSQTGRIWCVAAKPIIEALGRNWAPMPLCLSSLLTHKQNEW